MEELNQELNEVVVDEVKEDQSTELVTVEESSNNALAIAAVVGGVLVVGTLAYKGGKKLKAWLKKRKDAKSEEDFQEDEDDDLEIEVEETEE